MCVPSYKLSIHIELPTSICVSAFLCVLACGWVWAGGGVRAIVHVCLHLCVCMCFLCVCTQGGFRHSFYSKDYYTWSLLNQKTKVALPVFNGRTA